MVSPACSKGRPTTIQQSAIFLALRINTDESNAEHLARWREQWDTHFANVVTLPTENNNGRT